MSNGMMQSVMHLMYFCVYYFVNIDDISPLCRSGCCKQHSTILLSRPFSAFSTLLLLLCDVYLLDALQACYK